MLSDFSFYVLSQKIYMETVYAVWKDVLGKSSLPHSLSSRLPSKRTLSHLPYHGSMQMNGAFLLTGDHTPNRGHRIPR